MKQACAIILVFLFSNAARAVQVPDRCKPPLGGIGDCPDNFRPNPHPPKNPNPNDPRDIRKILKTAMIAANKAADAEAFARETLKLAEDKLRRASSRDLIDKAQTILLAAQRNFKPLMDANSRLHQAVLDLTVEAYGLRPPKTKFAAWPHNRISEWAPRFSEQEVKDKMSGRWRPLTEKEFENLRDELKKNPAIGLGVAIHMSPSTAKTWDRDGRISIFGWAFRPSSKSGGPDPDELAALIVHETIHWVDDASDPQNHRSLRENCHREKRAWGAQADFLKTLNHPSASAVKTISEQFGRQEAALEMWKIPDNMSWAQLKALHPEVRQWLSPDGSHGGIMDGDPGPRAPTAFDDLEAAKAGSSESFYENVERLGDIARGIQKRASQGEASRRQRNREFDESLQRVWKEQERARERIWEYLRTVAGLACSNPEAFAEQIHAGTIIDAGMGSPDLLYYLSRYGGSGPGTLSPCQSFVLERLNRARHPVSAQTVLSWAQDFHKEHPSLGRRVTTGLSDFFNSLSGILESKNSRGEGAGTNQRPAPPSSTQPERRNSPDPHDQNIPEPSGKAWNQLRGISGGSVGFD